MKIGLRILLGYCLIVGLAAWFVFNVFVEQVKPGVRSTQEDTLVDTANLLAAMVARDAQGGSLARSAALIGLPADGRRPIDVIINGVPKKSLDYRIYVTDRRGIVLFDSSGRDVGQDYSRWNDVYRTLRGQYGARSTRARLDDDASTVMHVAAPITDEAGAIIGVLTVAKPNASVQAFVERGQQKIVRRGALLVALSLLIGLAFSYWLAQALRKLMRYIGDVEAGKKVTLPKLGNTEFGTLGRALEAMRHRLEGKEYVEQLMHTLAHELKSPIAAIQGSAELLSEDMPVAERRHFLNNILNQNSRQKQLIDKLLALVRVEQQQQLSAPERIDLTSLLAQVQTDCAARLAARGLRIEGEVAPLTLRGDALLLRQAFGNLLDNAIDFAPPGSVIDLSAQRRGEHACVAVRDRGPGIPAYAAARLFERFYSLPRPDGAKSTGLGLPFVREVMLLHNGSVEVDNAAGGGARASVELALG
ncbi:MAG: two-component system sensor histidine kinase CreC [Pseudomonadota bacterium]